MFTTLTLSSSKPQDHDSTEVSFENVQNTIQEH